jgi:uncharacterized membrane protein YhhN
LNERINATPPMKTKYQGLLLLYWVILLADCFLIYSEMEESRVFTKTLLMPVLLLYFIGNSSSRHHIPSRILVIAALVAAWIGDYFLLKDGESDFITGLDCFLVMHVIYIIYFWRIKSLFPVKDPMNVWLPFLLIAVFDAVVMMQLLPLAGKLANPLLGYMVVISVMFIMACNVLSNKKSKTLAAPFFIPGALMFILSDTILGFNMFLWEDHLVGIAVMLTYGYAQHLVVHGCIKHQKGRI